MIKYTSVEYYCKFVAIFAIIASMDRENALFKDLLKNHGYSLTAPRQKLFNVLQNHNACTIAELTSLLKEYDRATIYRTVALFERLGIVSRLQLGWKYKLELGDIFHHHHHHLTCVNCGKVIILAEDKVIERQITRLEMARGFVALDHQLEIRGYCPQCSNPPE